METLFCGVGTEFFLLCSLTSGFEGLFELYWTDIHNFACEDVKWMEVVQGFVQWQMSVLVVVN
jgi:hypothetical protein